MECSHLRCVNMPDTIFSCVVKKGGVYTVLINASLSYYSMLKYYNVEIRHINNGDYDNLFK